MCVCVWFLGPDLEMYMCVHLFMLFVAFFFGVLSEGLLEILLLCPVSQADLAIL